MRYQGFTTPSDPETGELHGETSAYVNVDRNPDTNPAIFVDCSCEPSLTRQEFVDEANINNLMDRYEKNGMLTNLNRKEPAYFDASEVPDLQTSLTFMRDAEAAFMSLSGQIRATFENDPMRFIDFAGNPENLPQMQEWGLAPKPVPPAPQEVKVVSMPEPPPAK